MRKSILRGNKGRSPQSVRGVGKAQDKRFLRIVMLTAECIDEAQDVCFTYLPAWWWPEAFRSTVRVLGGAACK